MFETRRRAKTSVGKVGIVMIIKGRQKREVPSDYFTTVLFNREHSVQPREDRTNNAKRAKQARQKISILYRQKELERVESLQVASRTQACRN